MFTTDIINTRESSAGNVRTVRIKFEEKLYSSVVTIEGPTSNCQLSIIGSFCNLLTLKDEDLKKVTKSIAALTALRKIILIDINRPKVAQVERVFKNAIINKMDYTSTNNSSMTIILLKTENL
jgi:hypothetical protein